MKKRPISHVIDNKGEELLRSKLPSEWVMRPYKPDYGIDFSIEVFDSVAGDTVSLGEHFFVQLKSTKTSKQTKKRVYPRFNVEKYALTHDVSRSMEIDVLSVSIERAELQLAQSMGPAVPLLLVVADIVKAKLNWVCLNDFADKVLLPTIEQLENRHSHTVHVPEWNRLDGSERDWAPLRLYARRAKLYAAFNRFRYQRHEVLRVLEGCSFSTENETQIRKLVVLVLHFLRLSLSYDFWLTTFTWPTIELTHNRVTSLRNRLERAAAGEALNSIFLIRDNNEKSDPPNFDFVGQHLLFSEISSVFEMLSNLGNVFEEICREWFLPTYLGKLAEENALL